MGNHKGMSPRVKILNVVGARPNLPKIAPLMHEMQRHEEIEAILVHTGQHYDENLSDIFFRQMGIPSPHVNLDVGSGSHASQTAEILKRIEPVLLERKPDLVLVVGDVNSTIAVSLAAAKLGIGVAHVEAGLRSYDRSMPEEINRVLTDSIADYLFVTEQEAIDNLLREGRPRESIFMVGNVMIDSLRHFLPIAQQSAIGDELGLKNGGGWQRFGVLTLHRPSNVDEVQKLGELLGAVNAIASELPIIFPVHPRTQQRLTQSGIHHHPQLRLIAPAGYLDFLCLLSKATLVLTDSGGIQEETTALGVPCLTLRQNTERPVTISEGTNLVVGTDPSKIVAAARDILSNGGKAGKVPPLWDGHAAGRIVEILLRVLPRSQA
ncbi:MAG TPA: UDP-N-acetylglucosamine 2-epimerase (non-hydrolyzing) [Candidatus Dormibacteraeota bacterium]|nr:UDP-N-acetylglucosamine 2-epimerase (non-hydrolyzing) [Candidatus Dormibacteraeota bacterium]